MDTLYKDNTEGGIRLLDIKSFDSALKLKWLKFLREKCQNPLHTLMSRNLNNLNNINWQINISPKYLNSFLSSYKDGFVKNIVNIWINSNHKSFNTQTSGEELRNQCLWLNSYIRVLNKPIFYKEFVSKQILKIKDIMKSRNDFFTYAELCTKYNYRFQIMQYNSLLSAIPWKKNELKNMLNHLQN